MQKKSLPLLGFIIIAIFNWSCKKDKGLSTEALLIGEWDMVSIYQNSTIDGENRKNTAYYNNHVFVFKEGGLLNITINGTDHRRGNWEILDKKLMITNTGFLAYVGGFTIRVLNKTQLELYYTQTLDENNYYEMLFTFKK